MVVLVIDASQSNRSGCRDCGEADRLGRGIIIAANKWDLTKDNGPDFVKRFDAELKRQLKFLDYAKILHVSASTGERTPRLLETIDKVAESRQRREQLISTNSSRSCSQHPLPVRGRSRQDPTRRQTSVAPPTFVFSPTWRRLSTTSTSSIREPAARGIRIRRNAYPDPCSGSATQRTRRFERFEGLGSF